MNASNFSNNDSAALEALINKKQVADMMKLYGNLVERCFASCSTDFSTKSLNSKEQTCVEHCADKFLNLSNRVGLRFSEYNADQMAKMQQ